MAKRIEFICPRCNIKTSQTIPNYYKQRKKRGINICSDCARSENNHNMSIKMKEKYAIMIKNTDKIQLPCSKCGKMRIIQYRERNANRLCVQCSVKRSFETNKERYLENLKNFNSNPNKSIMISNGIFKKIPSTIRQENSKKASAYWKDEIEKERVLRLRNTIEYRKKMKNIWLKEGYRERRKAYLGSIQYRDKMKEYWEKLKYQMKEKWCDPIYRKKMSIMASELWSDPLYRNKMTDLYNSQEYKNKMFKIFNNPEFRKKMAIIRTNQPKTSKQQEILYSLLADLNINYYDDKNNKCRIGYFCFDCRIDPQKGIKLDKPLLIEVQGDYWHNLPRAIARDKSKSTYIRTYFPEFDLKYLWEHEFDNKDRIIYLLKYWLGVNKETSINFDFSLLQKKLIDIKEAEIFISKYHYAGRVGRSGINLGFYLNDNLIAVIIYTSLMRKETAIKQGYNYKEMLELNRLAIHPQYQIKNLASYLISKSINYIRTNNLYIKCLVSFADVTYNHFGTAYRASNWKYDGQVAPDYWYADDKGYICHKKTLWNKAKKNSMTEREYCIKHNYSRIWGDKKLRYVYKLDGSK